MRTPPVKPSIVLAGNDVRLERCVPILVRDGVRLSCDVYRPNRSGRFPAVLEHIPYRKDDLRAWQDRTQGVYLARRGIASVRLDVRGTGSSEGHALDEYTEEEQLDGVEAVGWIAEQPWCTGRVGAWGKSYGGFTAIQLAARQPPALGAIAAVYATDDRYTDDMHFDGGGLCAFELSNYPIRMIAMNALPPNGDIEDPEFLERWLARVDKTPPWILRWLREQRDSGYWRNGSLRPDYERIRCPVLVVAGWRDGYRTAALRMVQHLRAPWQLLAGPWTHVAPDDGRPGPPYAFLHELATWFRHHLAGEPAESRPRSVLFLAEADRPSPPPARLSGRWIASDRFPEEAQSSTTLHLNAGGRLGARPQAAAMQLACPFEPAAGIMNGNWCPPPPEHGMPFDQRADDARSLTFTSDPLETPVDVLGIPVVYLRVEHPGPSALVAVKLSDVSPDGTSVLVTRGVLNLAHREGHAEPRVSSGVVDVTIPLQATGWRFRSAQRIRLAVSGADWPVVWPLPTTMPITLHLGSALAQLELPGIPSDASSFVPTSTPQSELDGGGWAAADERARWEIVIDGATGRSGVRASDLWTARDAYDGTEVEEVHGYEALASETDPTDVGVKGCTIFRIRTSAIDVSARADGIFKCTADTFKVSLTLRLRANGRTLRQKRWDDQIARHLV